MLDISKQDHCCPFAQITSFTNLQWLSVEIVEISTNEQYEEIQLKFDCIASVHNCYSLLFPQ